jgi:hypothetical protein
MVLLLSNSTSAVAVPVQKVHQWACEQDQIGDDAQQVRAVLLPQQYDRHHRERTKYPRPG